MNNKLKLYTKNPYILFVLLYNFADASHIWVRIASDRVSKVTGNESISSVKFQEIIKRPEISNTFRFSDELLQEYRSWQTKLR